MTRTALLLGSGSSRDRRFSLPGDARPDWTDYRLVTVDMNPRHEPTVVHDLNVTPWPLESDSFDRVDAYEVLEHLGRQGDYRAFFACFEEVWRVLKPGGFLCATTPSYKSMWAWGDPSHTRVITSGSLVFLDQQEYARQVGKTAMTDYRFCYRGDFERILVKENDETLKFILRARK